MIWGSSRSARLEAHDAPSAEGARKRAGDRQTSAGPAMLRLFRLLALAIVAVVCAGITSPTPGVAKVAPRPLVAAADSAVLWALAPHASQQWRHAARPAVDLQAVETDLDDDDDGHTRSDLFDDASRASGDLSFPRNPARSLRGAHPIDTSRFAMGTGLPRGPPAAV